MTYTMLWLGVLFVIAVVVTVGFLAIGARGLRVLDDDEGGER